MLDRLTGKLLRIIRKGKNLSFLKEARQKKAKLSGPASIRLFVDVLADVDEHREIRLADDQMLSIVNVNHRSRATDSECLLFNGVAVNQRLFLKVLLLQRRFYFYRWFSDNGVFYIDLEKLRVDGFQDNTVKRVADDYHVHSRKTTFIDFRSECFWEYRLDNLYRDGQKMCTQKPEVSHPFAICHLLDDNYYGVVLGDTNNPFGMVIENSYHHTKRKRYVCLYSHKSNKKIISQEFQPSETTNLSLEIFKIDNKKDLLVYTYGGFLSFWLIQNLRVSRMITLDPKEKLHVMKKGCTA